MDGFGHGVASTLVEVAWWSPLLTGGWYSGEETDAKKKGTEPLGRYDDEKKKERKKKEKKKETEEACSPPG